MLRSLYGRLALALLALVGLIAVLYAVVGAYSTGLYLQEARQKLNRELAAHLIDEGLLRSDGEVDPEGLEHVIHMLMVINPSIEVYVLGREGEVLAYSTPPGKLHRERVGLEPVRRFLAGDEPLPILGDDPRDPDGRKVFSAAAVGDPGDPDGYVYVVLGGQLHDSVLQRLAASQVLRLAAAALLAGMVFALAAGLLGFALLTRRLRRLDAGMAAFEESGFAAPVEPARGDGEGRGDEIDRLGRNFAGMAGRIRDQLGRLEQGDRMRRELVANVSHDLRTPLAALHGYLETLVLKGDTLTEEERRSYLETAVQHSGKLGRRVGDLFELAKLDASEVPLRRERFSLAELVQDAVQKFRIEAGRKEIGLHTARGKSLHFVEADIGLIERALENLLANAIRHTPRGGQVTVSVEEIDREARVTVRDTGPGIPADELASVFDRYYRCRADETGDGGAGLGLAITKRIVDLHGGTISAASRPGEGAAFTFSLPIVILS